MNSSANERSDITIPAPDSPSLSRALVPAGILLTLGMLWGGNTSLSRYVGTHGVPVIDYAFFVTTGSGVLLAAICALGRRRVQLTRAHLRYFFICGVLGSALPTTSMLFVLTKIPAGLMAVVLASAPLLTYGFALLFRVERIEIVRFFGIGLGLAGALLILLPRGSLPDPAIAPYVMLAFLTPALYALNGVYAARHRPDSGDSLIFASGMMISAGVLLMPAAVVSSGLYPLWHLASLADGLVIAHMGIAALAFTLYFVLLRISGAVFASQVAYLVTLFGIGFGWLIFGERLGPWVWFAVVLTFTGVALVNLRLSKSTSAVDSPALQHQR